VVVRDLQRLSVDIDLTYLPIEDRTASLANVDAAMQRLNKYIPDRSRTSESSLLLPRFATAPLTHAAAKEILERSAVASPCSS
jgi:hypothetical protein